MTQEEKQLLIKDLCARLPYRTKVLHNRKIEVLSTLHIFDMQHIKEEYVDIKPYLRPISSMTEGERSNLRYYINEYGDLEKWGSGEGGCSTFDIQKEVMPYIDWLNAHHFDYRGLISMGLALEAPKDMYKTE